MQLAFCHDVADSGRDQDDDGKHGLNVPTARARVNAQAAVDILPALKDGDSHYWRHMSVPGKDI